MRKLFMVVVTLVICGICIGAMADVELTDVNFPNANFLSYLKDHQPRPKDDVLTDEEIAKITFIDVSSKSISDLTGIQYFTSLKQL